MPMEFGEKSEQITSNMEVEPVPDENNQTEFTSMLIEVISENVILPSI
jgi:hypothetical protein